MTFIYQCDLIPCPGISLEIYLVTQAKMARGWVAVCLYTVRHNCVTFGHSSGNYCPHLMILSTLWTEKICIQAQSIICHHTLIQLLHYLAQTTGVYVTTKALRFYHIAFQQRVKN